MGITPPHGGEGPHPDATLLAVCAQLRAMQAEWQRLYDATSDADELATDADRAWQDYSDHVWPAVALAASGGRRKARIGREDVPARLHDLHATTPEGIAAKAAAIVALDDAGHYTDLRDDAYELTFSLLEDAAGALRMPLGAHAGQASA